VYAVNTQFQNAGVDTSCWYTLVIGHAILGDTPMLPPDGLTHVVAPASRRAVLLVEKGRFDQVGPAWLVTSGCALTNQRCLSKTSPDARHRYRRSAEGHFPARHVSPIRSMKSPYEGREPRPGFRRLLLVHGDCDVSWDVFALQAMTCQAPCVPSIQPRPFMEPAK
jgi:hypothetical protein